MDEGQRLAGGNLSPVYRVGDTVRRSTGPWTPAVHELLDHLAARDWPASPRVLGIDSLGREMLSFLPGDTVGDDEPFPDWAWTDDTLVEAVTLLREYHEIMRTFRPAGPRVWRFITGELHPSQVICHNDWAPYNVVRRDGRITGVIDWDIAGPSLPVSDLAFAAWTFVPLMTPDVSVAGGAATDAAALAELVPRRLRLLCDAYGLRDRGAFMTRVVARARSSIAGIRSLAARGEPGFVHLVEAGHLARMQRDAAYIASRAGEWQRAL